MWVILLSVRNILGLSEKFKIETFLNNLELNIVHNLFRSSNAMVICATILKFTSVYPYSALSASVLNTLQYFIMVIAPVLIPSNYVY